MCQRNEMRIDRNAALRLTAEAAGITSVAREDGQLVVRFGPGWSRVDTVRAMAPRSASDPVRAAAGLITYASNQMRVRLPRDAAAAWRLTRSIVERLAP